MTEALCGGCACGAIKYRCHSPPLEAGYCHCHTCQQTSGAPVLAFASFSLDDFEYTGSEPAIFLSSTHGRREFCSRCGTQIAYRDLEDAQTIEINACTLDDPTSVTPTYHIWCSSQVSWFEIEDSLPRYETGKPGN